MKNDRKPTMKEPDNQGCEHASGRCYLCADCVAAVLLKKNQEIVEIHETYQSIHSYGNNEVIALQTEIAELAAKLAAAENGVARVALLVLALEVIHAAIADGDGGSYWPARKFLDDAHVYHDDLNDLRVLGAVAKTALMGN